MHLKVVFYLVTLMKIKNMIRIDFLCLLFEPQLFICMINDQPFSSFFSSMLFSILNNLPLLVLDFPFLSVRTKKFSRIT